MVSSDMSIPPLKNIFLLSKSINLFLIPTTGCSTHPDPLPPVSDTLLTSWISNSWGSTIISLTLPDTTGSINASVPVELSISKTGGFTTS